MRYFVEVENTAQARARLLFAGGISFFVFGDLLGLMTDLFDDALVLFDLIGCIFLWMGSMKWTCRKWTVTPAVFSIAFALRLALFLFEPKGLFSFLLYLPYSVTVLVGLVRVLEGYREFTECRVVGEEREWTTRAQQALVRSEVSYWVAVFISYLSVLMAFPALLLYAFSIGVRIWVSVQFFRRPQFLSADLYLREKRLRAQ